MYENKPTTFDEMIAPFDAPIRTVTSELRALIFDLIPDAEENIYGGKKVANALYSLGGKSQVLCGLQPREDFCRFFVHHVKKWEDSGLELEGTGKNARHVKVSDLDSDKREALEGLLQEVLSLAGQS